MVGARPRHGVHHGIVIVEFHVRQLTNLSDPPMFSLRGGRSAGVLEAGERLCLWSRKEPDELLVIH